MKKQTFVHSMTFSIVALALATVGCSSGAGDSLMDTVSKISYAAKPANLRVSLIDAPTDLKEVHVNVDHIELYFHNGEKGARVDLAQDLGDVDLLKLQDGVQLLMGELDVPAQVEIKKIRIVLKETGHYSVKMDDSICTMQTPSAQQSGLKINLKEPVTFESDYGYSMIIDFDAKKSVVVKGNGDCLLKPVLKIPSFTRLPLEDIPDEGGVPDDNENEEPVTDGSDSNDDGTNSGSGEGSGSDDGSSGDDSSSSDDDSTSGSTGDGSTDDGTGDYVPIDPDDLVSYF